MRVHGVDTPDVLTGTFTAPGQSAAFASPNGKFDLEIKGTWNGSIQLERSLDGGQSWGSETALGNQIYTFTNDCEEVVEDPSIVLFRLNCTALSSGSAIYTMTL